VAGFDNLGNRSTASPASDGIIITSVTSTPAAPSNLSAEAVSFSSISLSWTDNSNNEAGFKLYRNSADAGWDAATLAKTISTANVTSTTDTGLSASSLYYYRIKTYNDAGSSDWSNTTSTTTLAAEVTPSAGYSAPSVPAMPTTTTGEVISTASAGGKTSLTTVEGAVMTVELPIGAVSADTIVKVVSVTKDTILAVASIPAGKSLVSAFDLSATSEGVAVITFEKDVTLTFTYTDEQIEGLDEETLKIYYWDGTQWATLPSVVDTATNTVTGTTSHFTYYIVMASIIEIEEEKPAELTIEKLEAKIAELVKEIAALKVRIQQIQLAKVIPADYKFEKNLKYGQKSLDVKYLQEFLKAQGTEIYPEALVTSYFGPLTRAAVIRFQEKYISDILTPWNLTAGTGLVGTTTRAKINEILGR